MLAPSRRGTTPGRPETDQHFGSLQAAPNENGELVCKIDMESPFEAFVGYYGNEAGTNKKILHDVFEKVRGYLMGRGRM
jgi:hypothetical protein